MPDVDHSVLCIDSIGAEKHSLQEAVWVALHDGAVHERAGVAFVTVCDNEIYIRPCALGMSPFAARGESGSASSAKVCLVNLIEYFVGGHGADRLGQSAVPAEG